MVVAEMDKLDVAEPEKDPLVAAAGNMAVPPLIVKPFPFRFKIPLVKFSLVETVKEPPSVTVPRLARFIMSVFNVCEPPVDVIVPKLPVPPMLNTEFAPPVMVPAPVMVPLSVHVKVVAEFNCKETPLFIFKILLTVVLAVVFNVFMVPLLAKVRL